jgi:hypothetical protein
MELINVVQFLNYYHYRDYENGTDYTNIDEDKLVDLLQLIVNKLEIIGFSPNTSETNY